jgi:hypothetical protein
MFRKHKLLLFCDVGSKFLFENLQHWSDYRALLSACFDGSFRLMLLSCIAPLFVSWC